MKINKINLNDAFVIEIDLFSDNRGYFFESFNKSKFKALTNTNFEFVQDNHSRSSKHILRGMHYQIKRAQDKLVRVSFGSVYDVIVDLRLKSSTFGKWFGIELSSDNKKQLFVPKGFAHGFIVLSEYAEFQYKTTDYFYPEYERVLRWNCPNLKINWPVNNPKLNERDSNAPDIKDCELFN